MSINDYFDKIYCINLDKRTDKWEQCISEFTKHNLKVERFSAIDGTLFPKNERVSAGNVGCCISHATIMRKMLHENLSRVLILEDDVEFIPNVQQYFSDSISFIPQWDMLYLGGNNVTTPRPVNTLIGKMELTYTTSHYAITADMAKVLIHLIESGNEPVDVAISRIHKITKSFIFSPAIAWQRAGHSDIENAYKDYTSFMKPIIR